MRRRREQVTSSSGCPCAGLLGGFCLGGNSHTGNTVLRAQSGHLRANVSSTEATASRQNRTCERRSGSCTCWRAASVFSPFSFAFTSFCSKAWSIKLLRSSLLFDEDVIAGFSGLHELNVSSALCVEADVSDQPFSSLARSMRGGRFPASGSPLIPVLPVEQQYRRIGSSNQAIGHSSLAAVFFVSSDCPLVESSPAWS